MAAKAGRVGDGERRKGGSKRPSSGTGERARGGERAERSPEASRGSFRKDSRRAAKPEFDPTEGPRTARKPASAPWRPSSDTEARPPLQSGSILRKKGQAPEAAPAAIPEAMPRAAPAAAPIRRRPQEETRRPERAPRTDRRPPASGDRKMPSRRAPGDEGFASRGPGRGRGYEAPRSGKGFGTRSEARQGPRSDSRPDSRPGPRSGSRPSARPGSKPGPRPGSNPIAGARRRIDERGAATRPGSDAAPRWRSSAGRPEAPGAKRRSAPKPKRPPKS
jgi:23S rRNA pseudouridine2605 synthase